MTVVATTRRKHPLAECESCPLAKKACALTSGPSDAKIAFVSRSPGRWDIKPRVGSPRPFAGPSGRVLDHLLAKYNVSRDEILTTNIVLCDTDDPPPDAIKACKPRLESEIANCDLVIAGGAEAVKALTNRSSVGATRGFDFHKKTPTGIDQRIVVTNNPAMVLRNSDSFPDMLKDFRYAFDPIPPPKFPEVEVIDDVHTARGVLHRWLGSKLPLLGTDLEWHPVSNEIYAAGFAQRGEKAVTFGRTALNDGLVKRLLKNLYESNSAGFVWHNGQSDTKVLRRIGIQAPISDDTFLLSYALDEYPGRHSLDYLLQTNFGWPDYTPEPVKKFKKTGEIDDADLPLLYEYNGWDTAGTFQLFEYLKPKAEADDVWEYPYRNRLLPFARAFVDVELRGFTFDVEGAANINEEHVLPRLYELTTEMREITQHPLLNPRSNTQIEAVLYNEWGVKHDLKSTSKKKLATSVGKEVRTELIEGRFKCRPNTPDKRSRVQRFAGVHHRFARIDKQRGTYIEGLIVRVGADGKLYCEFNPGGTVTGRASSRNPNFQNITREGVEGIPGIRTIFKPSNGCKLLQADFSQAELRTCAVLSGDESLLSIYNDSTRSLHRERAAAFYGEHYTKEEYVRSKNINFGVTYGQSAFAFAQMYHMEEKEAQEYIDSWWAEFPTLLKWKESVEKQAQSKGVIRSPLGYKRRFHLITKENLGDVLREAVNFIPQNVAGVLGLHSLVDLSNGGIPVINTVHDSVLVDCPVEVLEETAVRMKQVMEAMAFKQLGWNLPFTVDVSVGDNWGSLEEIEVAA